MADIDRYRTEDRRQVDALYRRVFGPDAADASRLRWDWQYRRNPNAPADGPQIWIAREGATIVGQYATMPVTLHAQGQDIDASWGMDVMVAPERQRQGSACRSRRIACSRRCAGRISARCPAS
jgi:hypothetical protein